MSMANTKAVRLRYAKAAFELAPTTGATSIAYDAMHRVKSGEDKRSPLRRFAEDLIRRHDWHANDMAPPVGREVGRTTCGCMDCQLANAALEAETR